MWHLLCMWKVCALYSYGQRSLVGYSPWACKRVGHDLTIELGAKPVSFTSNVCCSVAQSCPTLCGPMDCSTPSFPVLHHLPELVQTLSVESMIPSNHLILCCPLLLLPLDCITWGKSSHLYRSRFAYWKMSIKMGDMSLIVWEWHEITHAVPGKLLSVPWMVTSSSTLFLCI